MPKSLVSFVKYQMQSQPKTVSSEIVDTGRKKNVWLYFMVTLMESNSFLSSNFERQTFISFVS